LIRNLSNLFFSILFCILLNGCASKNKDEYTGLTADQIYAKAQEHERKENFQLAVKDYEALEARFPYGEYADKAPLGLAQAYYKKGDAAQALGEVDRFIRMYPRHAKVDYAHYLKGLIYSDANMSFIFRHLPIDRSLREPTDAREAFRCFKEFLILFPKSSYANDARLRSVALRNQLANHELHIADYYVRRGAYVSAANRANTIITHFDKTPAVEPALHILIKAYQHMGMKELEQQTSELLNINFPHTTRTRN